MSVMVPISPSRRWLPFWPLALFVLLAGLGCLALWHYWPQVMQQHPLAADGQY